MQKYRVFYLDDDEEDIEIFLMATEHFNNLQVIVFTDSEVLLKKLHLVARVPNALFLDSQMPRVSGYEVVKEVRIHDQFSEMPIIILSGAEPRNVEMLRSAGANYFVVKPMTIEKFGRTLRHVFDIDFKTFAPSIEDFVLKDIDALAS